MEKEIRGNGVFTISGFMSVEECREWIHFSELQGYETAMVNVGVNKQEVNTRVRNNERFIYDDVELANNLWKKIQPYVVKETEYGIAYGLNERFRFYKYVPGQQFKPHKDGSYLKSIHEWSSYTFMIYLNEDMAGGETKFPDCSIKPKTGNALVFKHEITHEGCPVLEGVKYVLRTDIMYQRKPKV